MRSTADRIRHAVSFEILALALITPLGAWAFDMAMRDIGIVSLLSALVAMAWNYLYNLIFDHAMQRISGHSRKTMAIRALHAILFEIGLLAVLMPFIAWYLDISLFAAFLINVGFAMFFVIYAFFFNWAYDWLFPIR
ncbi:MAG: PACE efflux transporter [Jhaorihella sp.]